MTAVPRFNAAEFQTVTPEMAAAYARDGVLVLDGLIAASDCDALRAHMDSLVSDFDVDAHRSVFSTTKQSHAQDDYFLSSGHETRFFFEDGALDPEGRLRVDRHKALNKVGHAMHDLDPVFDRFSRQPRLRALTEGLGIADPLLLQSMYIFKQPGIGGEVVCHQDATYLWTEPQTVIGLWVALEDATVDNGCLWGIPGGHKGATQPKTRFRRAADGRSTYTQCLDDSPFDESAAVPLNAPKGTVLAFSGLFPHLSAANTSPQSRHAYTLHVIDGAAHYPADNWLKRPNSLPLSGFDQRVK